MGRTGRWWVAGLMTLITFAGAAWVSGSLILMPLLASAADRWAVASGIGVAMSAFTAMWGQWWATRDDEPAPSAVGDKADTPRAGHVIAPGDHSIAVGGNNQGIASTGDHASNVQT